ncbi:hypothetical protein GBA63_08895 [Rubrobacter tropicus]|uniref:Uncharacterized protein n=2 Tax=Rubrobacter tropicus TaxID=2653851 RepID=A0A6G8Q8E9_9ACTN|nr:hypothetical protein GBA63_08895 [Rubrobacter tropicus]
MAEHIEKRLKPAEVEMILRRASELNARRWEGVSQDAPSVSPEVLVQVAAAAGIPEQEVRRAMWDLSSEKTAEPHSFAWKVYGPARLRAVREVQRPAGRTREHLEGLLRLEQGLKVRRKTEMESLWDPGDELGVVRRTLDFSGDRTLLKTRSVEVRVEAVEDERCAANVTADIANQRAEYLSLGGILGVTLAALFVLAGMQNGIFLLGVLPALAAPALGFRLAYRRAAVEIRRALDDLLDAVEQDPSKEELPPDRGDREPGSIKGLKPIPRFTSPPRDE